MSKKKSYYVRKFLNKSRGAAMMEINATYGSYSLDCSVDISDCNRKISLDFYIYDNKTYKEKMDKLELLINELNNTKEYLKEAYPKFQLEKNGAKNKKALGILSMVEDDEDD